MPVRLAVSAGLLAAMAACTQPEEPAHPPAPSNACGASGLQGLVGKDRRVLNTKALAQDFREIGPDMPVTADYSPERLNVEYDTSGRITKIACY
ncbi:I78 family peptidase inhibitor [Paracoccus aerodenitrificans]|uniref:I78 family peptidase inhibitor n=1 Tax=Paracoccus aerodenitrificans TaxID=3017781 RepID=UPI0022F08597|nr:I78 family peptidase inhibitor [Paracoccus aerodenitrificans]WBU64550.1 I78 family peptidase inhibitor [Paracoccus aerodenitrificans]